MNAMPSLRQIAASLGRHKTMLAIIVLQIGLTCAILCNALDVIVQRVERFTRPSGLQEDSLVWVKPSAGGAPRMDFSASDVATLRALPAVASVSVALSAPMVDGIAFSGRAMRPGAVSAGKSLPIALYAGDEQLLPTLGIDLIAGRNVMATEVNPADSVMGYAMASHPVILVSARVAERLFAGESAVGRQIMASGNEPSTIVGVYREIPTGAAIAEGPADDNPEGSVILPVRGKAGLPISYLLRVRPEAAADAVAEAATGLRRNDAPGMLAERVRTYAQLRADAYRKDIAMVWLLSTIMTALLAVNAFGIVGLASFWVQQRTQQIGIRRALGATRGAILRHFQAENFLIVGAGIALGMLMAFGINQLLMWHYALPRLSWIYLPIGALLLWGLGQLAVLAPALRAAAIPPATATRGALG